ncbi:hypothetical protein O3Q52_07195 [Streptomyces sp. ActVer]|uniref:hypothetical protein n=1 Tax=Streptomyces sp. ActVer TaxID=3014558 RepID=UPI0022B2CC41|nr:hypothetical protein [Streptomyces sp. ActVer]MCZ4507991.1 hypothetical protein [Streptomyces sp. ActVer]
MVAVQKESDAIDLAFRPTLTPGAAEKIVVTFGDQGCAADLGACIVHIRCVVHI